MDSAPEWTNTIQDSTLCGFFYIFFIAYSVIAAITLLGGLWVFFGSKMSGSQLFTSMFSVMLSLIISGTAALFLYLICERALQPKQKPSKPSHMM